ncbi:MAG: hypothetical protein KIT73_06460 [Burkholderiales bacterium]|nr:hypothetical protein [Burkholderiales bacterium]
MVFQGTSSRDLSILGIVGILVALAAPAWLRTERVEAPRPPPPKMVSHQVAWDLERIDARLWEDPFAAWARHRAAEAAARSAAAAPGREPTITADDLRHWIRGVTRYDRLATVLFVPVDAGRHPEAAESRRRVRVAFQSAVIQTLGSVLDEEHVGVMRLSLRGSAELGLPPIDVPFDRFTTRDGRPGLALWLDEDYFFDEPEPSRPPRNADPPAPLQSGTWPLLQLLARSLTRAEGDGDNAAACAVDVSCAVVGPGDSGQLLRALQVPAQPADRPVWATVYSPASTVAEKELIDAAASPTPACEDAATLACHLRARGLDFVRLISEDDAVVSLLSEELDQRRRAIHGDGAVPCRILLVTEADSLYAKKLARGLGEIGNCIVALPEGPTAYYVFRDLNDPLALATTAEFSDRSSGGGAPDATSAERAEGDQQFDYVRRLAARMDREIGDEALDADHVFAIGIFGNDVYDKVSLIKALRPRFRHARFFTTDLDARLWDPAHLPHTRNLIVASAYGLEAGRDQRVPPFRGVYQLAYYDAFRMAIAGRHPGALPAPRRFEIGLRGPIELGVPQSSPVQRVVGRYLEATGLQTVGVWLIGAVAIVVAACALWWMLMTFWHFVDWGAWRRGRDNGRISQRLGLVVRLLLALVAVVVLALTAVGLRRSWGESLEGLGEPLALLEGASLWGPCILRVLALALGIVFTIRFLERARFWERRLGKRYRLYGRPLAVALQGQPFRFRDYLPLGQPLRDAPADALWLEHERRSCGLVLAAAIVAVLAFVITAGVFVLLPDPNLPARGEHMAALQMFLVRANGVVLYAMAFVAFFHLLLTRALVQALTMHHTTLHHRDTVQDLWLDSGGQGSVGPEAAAVADGLLDIRLIREHTVHLQWFVYAPLIVVTLLLLARWKQLEYQTFPFVLVLVFAAIIGLSVVNAVRLQGAATRARIAVLGQMRRAERKLQAIARWRPRNARADQSRSIVETWCEEVEAARGGAFRPIWEQPFFRALLIPFGSAGLIEVVELLKILG